MRFLPEYSLTLVNGFLLMLPLFFLRFGLPRLLNREALAGLDHFPELRGREKAVLPVYLVTNVYLIFSPAASPIRPQGGLLLTGGAVYLAGLAFTALAVYGYCANTPLKRTGIYRISRNPMYIGYFGIFLGVSVLIGSLSHVLITAAYQVSVHYIILSEERWCSVQFGKEYEAYRKSVPRYLLFRGL